MQNDRQQTGIDGRTLAIGVLSITACILFVGYLLLAATPRPVFAAGQLDRGGDFIMLTQQLSSSVEGVVVIDAASRRMVLYTFDYNSRQLVPMDGTELDKLVRRPDAARSGTNP